MIPIDTPCIKICALDPASGLCRGCGRSGDEIAGWISFSAEDRRRIMAQAEERLKTLRPNRLTTAPGSET
jgi:predicted Fe-S protein YdhL (DUF1289 family)